MRNCAQSQYVLEKGIFGEREYKFLCGAHNSNRNLCSHFMLLASENIFIFSSRSDEVFRQMFYSFVENCRAVDGFQTESKINYPRTEEKSLWDGCMITEQMSWKGDRSGICCFIKQARLAMRSFGDARLTRSGEWINCDWAVSPVAMISCWQKLTLC